MSDVAERILEIRDRIDEAIRQAGREANSLRLVAVSKRQPMDRLHAAYEAGLRDFGENYAQGLIERAAMMPSDVRWHMIGHLQKNKAKKLLGAVDLIQTVDSERLIEVLARHGLEPIKILLQVNVGEESQKSGVLARDLPQLLESCLNQKQVQIKGLMTIPPRDNSPRKWYAKLRILRDEMATQFDLDLKELSMGMSVDFESAILEGATLIRVGTQVFGPRPSD